MTTVRGRWRTVWGIAGPTCCILLSACSHEANISRRNGIYVTGRITHSDKDALYIRLADGRSQIVPGDQITDIDHPGTFQQILGAVLLLLTASVAENTDNSAVAKLGYMSPSIAILGWGAYAYLRSNAAAKNLGRRSMSSSIVPPPSGQTKPQDRYLPAPTWDSVSSPPPKTSTQPSKSEPRPSLPTPTQPATPSPPNQPSTPSPSSDDYP